MIMIVIMMSTSASPNDHQNHIMSQDQEHQSLIISSSTCPISWKLYTNPFFSSTNPPNYGTNYPLNNPLKLKHFQKKYSASIKHLHHLQPDLKMNSFTNSSDHQELNQLKTQVADLKAELEMERKLRKKMETLNKKLSKELIDQSEKSKKKICFCEDLTMEISRLKEEMEKMKKDMEEERKMLRVAEVLREERVQMKLADAHLYYNHKMKGFSTSCDQTTTTTTQYNPTDARSEETLCEQRNQINGSFNGNKNGNVQRKASPEAENPHIRQGIKGFVEFQRAIKARNNGSSYSSSSCSSVGSSKHTRDLGSYSNKLECQKAQLRVFFKQKGPIPYSHHEHLVLS